MRWKVVSRSIKCYLGNWKKPPKLTSTNLSPTFSIPSNLLFLISSSSSSSSSSSVAELKPLLFDPVKPEAAGFRRKELKAEGAAAGVELLAEAAMGDGAADTSELGGRDGIGEEDLCIGLEEFELPKAEVEKADFDRTGFDGVPKADARVPFELLKVFGFENDPWFSS